MALQSTGFIRLAGNDTGRSVAKELNLGTSGVHTPTISLGQNNVRALAQRTGSVSVGLGHLRGKSAGEVQTVTVGVWAIPNAYFTSYYYGYRQSPSTGSISDGTLGVASNRTIAGFHWNDITNLGLYLSGSASNSGWTTVTINGIALSRSSATFMTVSGNSRWLWMSQTTNPFGTTTGATKAAVFT